MGAQSFDKGGETLRACWLEGDEWLECWLPSPALLSLRPQRRNIIEPAALAAVLEASVSESLRTLGVSDSSSANGSSGSSNAVTG